MQNPGLFNVIDIHSFHLYVIAVREDRMPGGRNSGAVYNLYKVLFIIYSNKIYCFKLRFGLSRPHYSNTKWSSLGDLGSTISDVCQVKY